MYNDNKKANQLIEELKKRRTHELSRSEDYSDPRTNWYFYEFMSEDRLDRCIAIAKDSEYDYRALDRMRREGLLNCTPALRGDKLVFGYGRFVGWRHDCYHIYNWFEGGTTIESLFYRLDGALAGVASEEAYFELMAYSAMSAALLFHRTTKALLREDWGIEMFDKMLHHDAKAHYNRDVSKYSIKNILDKIEEREYSGRYTTSSCHVVQLCDRFAIESGSDSNIGYLIFRINSVTVVRQEAGKRLARTIEFPSWLSECDVAEHPGGRKDSSIIQVMVQFLLMYCGISIDPTVHSITPYGKGARPYIESTHVAMDDSGVAIVIDDFCNEVMWENRKMFGI